MIEANSTSELVVSFAPDHQSQYFADTLDIKLNGQSMYTFDITGQAWGNNMYSILPPKYENYRYKKYVKIKPIPYEFMTASDIHDDEDIPPPKALILMFVHHTSDKTEGVDTVEPPPVSTRSASGKGKGAAARGGSALVRSGLKIIKEVEVGCIKTAQVKKASAEFIVFCPHHITLEILSELALS